MEVQPNITCVKLPRKNIRDNSFDHSKFISKLSEYITFSRLIFCTLIGHRKAARLYFFLILIYFAFILHRELSLMGLALTASICREHLFTVKETKESRYRENNTSLVGWGWSSQSSYIEGSFYTKQPHTHTWSTKGFLNYSKDNLLLMICCLISLESVSRVTSQNFLSAPGWVFKTCASFHRRRERFSFFDKNQNIYSDTLLMFVPFLIIL